MSFQDYAFLSFCFVAVFAAGWGACLALVVPMAIRKTRQKCASSANHDRPTGICPNCGNDDMSRVYHRGNNIIGEFSTVQCGDCGWKSQAEPVSGGTEQERERARRAA